MPCCELHVPTEEAKLDREERRPERLSRCLVTSVETLLALLFRAAAPVILELFLSRLALAAKGSLPPPFFVEVDRSAVDGSEPFLLLRNDPSLALSRSTAPAVELAAAAAGGTCSSARLLLLLLLVFFLPLSDDSLVPPPPLFVGGEDLLDADFDLLFLEGMAGNQEGSMSRRIYRDS